MWDADVIKNIIIKLSFLNCYFIKVGVFKQSIPTQMWLKKKPFELPLQVVVEISDLLLLYFPKFPGNDKRGNELWLQSRIILKITKWKKHRVRTSWILFHHSYYMLRFQKRKVEEYSFLNCIAYYSKQWHTI